MARLRSYKMPYLRIACIAGVVFALGFAILHSPISNLLDGIGKGINRAIKSLNECIGNIWPLMLGLCILAAIFARGYLLLVFVGFFLIGLIIDLFLIIIFAAVISLYFVEEAYIISMGMGFAIGWVAGRYIFYPIALRFHITKIEKLRYFACYFLVLAFFVIGVMFAPQEKDKAFFEYFWGDIVPEAPIERIESLGPKIFEPLNDWMGKTFMRSEWLISPTHSKIIDFVINCFYVVVKASLMLIILVAFYIPVYAIVIVYSILYLILCYSVLPASIIVYPLESAGPYVARAIIWVINDISRANIVCDSKRIGEYFFAIGTCAVYAFVPALYLRYIVFNFLWYVFVKPSLKLYAIVVYGKKLMKKESELELMKNPENEVRSDENKTVETKKYDISLPAKLDVNRISSDIQKYSGDEGLLKHYFMGIAQRFKSKNDRKVIEETIKRLNLEKEYTHALTDHRIATHQLFRVDMEEIVKRTKLEEDIDLAQLSKSVKRAELEAQIAKFNAERAQYEAKAKEHQEGKKIVTEEKKDELKEKIQKTMNKITYIEEFKQRIRDEHADDPEKAEEIIDDLIRQLIEDSVIAEE